MTNRLPYFYAILFFLSATLTSCEIIGDIFKAGIWTGLIIVVLFVGLIIWIIGRLGGRK